MHLAIIPDGNRRWAKQKGIPGFMGHKKGAETMEQIISAAFDMDVTHLTIWGASVANVTERSKEEVDFLFSVFEDSFKRLLNSPKLSERKARVRILGEWRNRFSDSLKNVCEELINNTEKNDGPSLTFMLAYSGTGEILEAAKNIAERKAADQSFEITRESYKESLMTKELPPVDLVIRTGGEPHWSDAFMAWDTANAQLYFTETFWPAFSEEELKSAIDKFNATERRMGK
ncbi:MAG: polyprenyl diphosphate synthase [Candidatus Colwellbacteria bacterium]|nr:polyprenyl diphosphate synthase [Candidatus Colwellbacteria bacterium]